VTHAAIFDHRTVERLRERADRQDESVRAERDLLAAEVRMLRAELRQRDAVIFNLRRWGRRQP
jgi:hypothetical protein